MFYKHSQLPISLIYTKLLIYNNFAITNVAFGAILMWHLAAKKYAIVGRFIWKKKKHCWAGGGEQCFGIFLPSRRRPMPGD